MNKYDNFYDESDIANYPPKPIAQEAPKGLISISLNFIFYLLIYLFLFQGDLRFLAAILMVMFIHEFGHFAWMRKLGYSERRLFFIPFMNFFLPQESEGQITLKEKLFLLFSGPIPGIVIGVIFLLYGNKIGNQEFIQLGWIFLVWNLLNLLPLDTLDGGIIAESLTNGNEYTIKLIATIITSCVIVIYSLASQSYLSLIIPVFLLLRIRSLKQMNELRWKLENKGIDWRINFIQLNNKQYWLIRKELSNNSENANISDSLPEMAGEIMNSLIHRQINSILLNGPYVDLSKKGIILAICFWLFAFIAPILLLFIFL
jgi:Zn-dependent protease